MCIVCGGGHNGADGVVLARLLQGNYEVSLYLPFEKYSEMTVLQLKRADAVGVKRVSFLERCDLLVDALFGSGLSRAFDAKTETLIKAMNDLEAQKIACDIPSGIGLDGRVSSESFRADVTLTMGALKLGMFSDEAKDFVGEVLVLYLGVSRSLYETSTPWKLLEVEDLVLPHRLEHNTHKGSYGHLSVICGEKAGAAVMSGLAGFSFGAGLVTLISNENVDLPYELMQSHLLPETTTAIALGMGLGCEFSNIELETLLDNERPLVLDADIFSHPLLSHLLLRENIVITPHPKEFVSLLKVCGLADISVAVLQKERFKYVELFCAHYPKVTLLLKGAHVIIGQESDYFINPLGTSALAKGGSGDVLSGLIGALLAQGYKPLAAAIQGSLAHTLAAVNVKRNSYALKPSDLIEAVGNL